MATYNFPTVNNSGVDQTLTEVALAVNTFVPMFLAFIFLVVMIAGYRKQSIRTGVGDAPLWGTIAGIVTTITALILSLTSQIINLPTLVSVILITIIFAIWLFASKDKV